jgi:hypothetical protein
MTHKAYNSALDLSISGRRQLQGCNQTVHDILEPIFVAPVPMLAQILQWLQKRPELLELELLAVQGANGGAAKGAPGSYSALWAQCVQGKCPL